MTSEVARRKCPEVAVYECYEGEGKHCATCFPEHSPSPQYSLNENSDHPVSATGSFIDSFTKWTKCLNHCIKLYFWIHPALWHAAIERGGALSRSSAFMLLLGNTRRWGKQNRGKIKPSLITTQTHLKQKKVFLSHATSFMSNCRVYKSPASTTGGTDWGRGTILGTLPLLCSGSSCLTYWIIRTWPFPKHKDPLHLPIRQ